MDGLKFSILIPAYNAPSLLKTTIESILKQSFRDYEIIVCDDCSTDNTEEAAMGFGDGRIRYFRNRTNLGYGKNLQSCFEKAVGDVVFLMGHDDILLKDALLKTYNAFGLDGNIGVVTRPYYWFFEDPGVPVRAVRPYDRKKDAVLSVFDGEEALRKIFESAGQLSGLAFMRKYVDVDFHEEIFPAHIYPLASILRKYKAVYLKDYTVAVRLESSMTRHRPDIYRISPTKSWIKMFETVYSGYEYKEIKKQCIEFITTENFAGLIQLKTSGSIRILLKEILILIRYHWLNIFDVRFWFFTLGSMLIPGRILRWLADNYKREILSRKLKDIPVIGQNQKDGKTEPEQAIS